jgi:glycosyltransferase involved in cell wall biosynthesis
MRSVAFLVPGRIDTRTGGSIYDRRMTEGLRQQGWSVEVRELDDTFPFPTPAALAHAAGVLAALPDSSIAVVDGLALGAMPEVVEREAPRLRVVALVHLPLAADAGFDRETAVRMEASERRALACTVGVIVTGPATLSMLARYELPPGHVIVVEPGTDRAPLARGSQGARSPGSGETPAGGVVALLSVATLNAGKGHELLLRALAAVPDHRWQLTCAGSLTRDPATADRVRDLIRALGLEDRVSLAGDLDAARLSECYDRADVFVLATRQETYGMAVAEALARGLPVVSTATGASPALVGDDAGLLVPPGNGDALRAALARIIGDAALRARLAEGARRVRDRLPSLQHASTQMSMALARLDTHG